MEHVSGMLFLGRVPSLETNIAPGKRDHFKKEIFYLPEVPEEILRQNVSFSLCLITSDVIFFASSYIISGCKLYFQNEGGWLLSYNKHA